MKISRRKFLHEFLHGGVLAGAALPFLQSRAAAPSQKVRLAFIGIGNRGWDDLAMFASFPEHVAPVAVCDLEMDHPRTLRARRFMAESDGWRDVAKFTDFRRMFDAVGKRIDAVVIATPDFSHFPAAMLAMSLGKAVYCEKPMGNAFREIALMTAAARRHGVVTQMGNQGHSDANYWQFRELVANGFIRDVTRIEAYMCDSRRWHKWQGKMTEMPAGQGTCPPGFDWDRWQSQRPARSFDERYLDGEWRSFYEYGTGALGDWGAHLFDTQFEFLRLGMPDRIEVRRCEGATAAVYPLASTVDFHFPARGAGLPACSLVWRDGVGNLPPLPAGITDRKWRRPKAGTEMTLADGRVFARGSHGVASMIIAGADAADPEIKRRLRGYPRGKSGHFLNFLNAVRREERANSDFAVAGPLSQLLALGAVAQRLGAGSYAFDRDGGKFAGDAHANLFLQGPPPRRGWEEYERL